MSKSITIDQPYKQWLIDIKDRIRRAQIKAAFSVNKEMLQLYWQFGEDIVIKHLDNVYGSAFFDNLSKELMGEFPDMKGFSARNLKYIKTFYLFYNQPIENRQQVVADLENTVFSIPWGHQIQSDLAQQSLKDPYNFDFLTMTEGYKERELEAALVNNITNLLLELGNGFAFIGKQVKLMVGDEEIFVGLLFYNINLRAYVVVELKAVAFDAAFIGQLGLYVSAVNHRLKTDKDNPTIGLLICKEKNKIKVQWALEASNQPIGVSAYQLTNIIPKEIESDLPSIEQIENELSQT